MKNLILDFFMSEKAPIISIIMATYNRGQLIADSLQSIKEQNFENWECLIIDDGSTDNTEEIVYSKTSGDSRFIFLKRKNDYKKGISGCRNYGLDIARGDYILFCDDDDIVHPENLSYCFNLLKEYQYDFIRYNKKPFFGNKESLLFDPVKKSKIATFSNREIGKMITGEIPFASCCVLWNKKCFQGERFNENLLYAEEWECYSRILMGNYTGLITDAVLYYNKKHSASNTGEFQKGKPVRVTSQLQAAELIINNFIEKKSYNETLKQHFLQMGFNLKSYKLIKLALKAAKANFLEKWKYKLGFKIYPILKPIFNLKAKILKP